MAEEKLQRNILVIDDELSVRKLAKLSLERSGYRVYTAADGEEGLLLAKVERPGVILLDLMMPKMNGHEVLKQLKSDPDTQNIPVVVVTAKGADRDRAASFRIGAVDHVEKPFKLDDIIKKIEMAFVLGKNQAQD